MLQQFLWWVGIGVMKIASFAWVFAGWGFLVLGLIVCGCYFFFGIRAVRDRRITVASLFTNMPRFILFVIIAVPLLCIQGIAPFINIVQWRKREKENPPEEQVHTCNVGALRAGDVILTGKMAWSYSSAIQFSNILSSGEENRCWTHAALYLGESPDEGAADVVEAQANGIGVRTCSLNDEYIQKGYVLRAFRNRYVTDDHIEKIRAFALACKEKGCGYDTWAVSFYVLTTLVPPIVSSWLDSTFVGNFFNVEDAYFCSELVAFAFKGNDINEPTDADICRVFPVPGWRVKPLDFIDNPFFVRVKEFEGTA